MSFHWFIVYVDTSRCDVYRRRSRSSSNREGNSSARQIQIDRAVGGWFSVEDGTAPGVVSGTILEVDYFMRVFPLKTSPIVFDSDQVSLFWTEYLRSMDLSEVRLKNSDLLISVFIHIPCFVPSVKKGIF